MRSWLLSLLLLGGCGDSVESYQRALGGDDGGDDAGDDGGDGGQGGGAVVISQIYGAGGNGNATWHHDYVELFNRGSAPVAIGGWSVQYGSSSSAFNLQANIPGGTILGAGKYFLVRLGSAGSSGADLPTPDLPGSGAGAFNFSASDGKFALVNNTQSLDCGSESNRCDSAAIIDLVGYGEGTDWEGSAAAPSPVGPGGAIFRLGGGCIDTDDNASDFVTGAASPRNNSTPVWSCADAALFDLSPPPDLRTFADLSAQPDLAGAMAGAPVVISQFYGAGGSSSAGYRNDFVELFNRGVATADIGGWSLQYASKDNTFALKVDVPDGTTLPAGGYYLIRLTGGSTGRSISDPDLAVNMPAILNIGASDGKLALVDHGTLLGCGSLSKPCAPGAAQDLVGYGAASQSEGAPAIAGGVTQSLFRKVGGCIDTDHNDTDFEIDAAQPRSSLSPIHLCTTLMLDAAAVDDGGAPIDASAPPNPPAARDLSVPPEDMEPTVVLMRDLGAPVPTIATGCGCHVGSAPSSPGWPAFALLALLLRRRPRVE